MTQRTRVVLPVVAAVGLAALFVASRGLIESDESTSRQGDVEAATRPSSLITAHVHGIARHPDSGDVLVATHDGLFVITGSSPPRAVGPTVDLMGFTVRTSGDLLASGHPGVGTDLPQPVGLIESSDGGKTWTVLSRGGQSDFHALSASAQGVLGYDGSMRASPDGRTWRALPDVTDVSSLTTSPDGATVLAATGAGLRVSTTHGDSWSAVAGAPSLVLVDWADEHRVVGADRDGGVFVSPDSGRTWERVAAQALGPSQAIGASIVGGRLEILAVTHAAILRSTDDGVTFAPLG